jgi:hypothetical protein
LIFFCLSLFTASSCMLLFLFLSSVLARKSEFRVAASPPLSFTVVYSVMYCTSRWRAWAWGTLVSCRYNTTGMRQAQTNTL